VGELEDEVHELGGVFLVIYTAYGWDQPVADAAEHIEDYFAGSYWTGSAPPISTTVFPTNAVVDMRTGVLLAGTGDIHEAGDFLGYLEQARRSAGDP
jgi:hypothetical protein